METVFAIVAEPNRRAILRQLATSQKSVGELEQAIRRQGLRFMTAMHHAENHFFFNHDDRYDTNDPRYVGLYCHPLQKGWPDKAFLDQWQEKLREVVDSYRPDLVWFDFGLRYVQ